MQIRTMKNGQIYIYIEIIFKHTCSTEGISTTQSFDNIFGFFENIFLFTCYKLNRITEYVIIIYNNLNIIKNPSIKLLITTKLMKGVSLNHLLILYGLIIFILNIGVKYNYYTYFYKFNTSSPTTIKNNCSSTTAHLPLLLKIKINNKRKTRVKVYYFYKSWWACRVNTTDIIGQKI